MRFLKIFSALVVCATLVGTAVFAMDDRIYTDVLRLHILANSDSEEDQKIKLEVRDFVLENFGALLAAATDRVQAEKTARALAPQIEESVNRFLSDKTDVRASVSVGERYFPTKAYGDYHLPCGTYPALCVELGDAAGKNFFCVLYPPLCLDVCEDADAEKELFFSCGLSQNEYELLRAEKPVYKLKFALLEWLKKENE